MDSAEWEGGGVGRGDPEKTEKKGKQTKRNIGPLGVFNSQLPWSMTRSRNVLMRGSGQMHQIRAETQINTIFLCFPFSRPPLPVMNKHDQTSASVI